MNEVENTIIDKIQAEFPVNRVVLLLTPLIILPLAVFVTAWVATHFPGINVDQNTVTTAVGGAALTVLTGLYKWVDGHQKDQSENKQLAFSIAAQTAQVQQQPLVADDVKVAKATLEAPPSIDGPAPDPVELEPQADVASDDFYRDEDLAVTAPGQQDDPDLS